MPLVALGLMSLLAQSAVPAPAPAPTVVTGRIVDDAGRAGIADARVTLVPVRAAGPPTAPFSLPATAFTDRDGRYTFENVTPGRYQINVQKAGFANATDL